MSVKMDTDDLDFPLDEYYRVLGLHCHKPVEGDGQPVHTNTTVAPPYSSISSSSPTSERILQHFMHVEPRPSGVCLPKFLKQALNHKESQNQHSFLSLNDRLVSARSSRSSVLPGSMIQPTQHTGDQGFTKNHKSATNEKSGGYHLNASSVHHNNTDQRFTCSAMEEQLHKVKNALIHLQKQIHRGEELYYQETDAYGNIFKGWDTLLDMNNNNNNSNSKPENTTSFLGGDSSTNAQSAFKKIPADLRWFSSSSASIALLDGGHIHGFGSDLVDNPSLSAPGTTDTLSRKNSMTRLVAAAPSSSSFTPTSGICSSAVVPLLTFRLPSTLLTTTQTNTTRQPSTSAPIQPTPMTALSTLIPESSISSSSSLVEVPTLQESVVSTDDRDMSTVEKDMDQPMTSSVDPSNVPVSTLQESIVSTDDRDMSTVEKDMDQPMTSSVDPSNVPVSTLQELIVSTDDRDMSTVEKDMDLPMTSSVDPSNVEVSSFIIPPPLNEIQSKEEEDSMPVSPEKQACLTDDVFRAIDLALNSAEEGRAHGTSVICLSENPIDEDEDMNQKNSRVDNLPSQNLDTSTAQVESELTTVAEYAETNPMDTAYEELPACERVDMDSIPSSDKIQFGSLELKVDMFDNAVDTSVKSSPKASDVLEISQSKVKRKRKEEDMNVQPVSNKKSRRQSPLQPDSKTFPKEDKEETMQVLCLSGTVAEVKEDKEEIVQKAKEQDETAQEVLEEYNTAQEVMEENTTIQETKEENKTVEADTVDKKTIEEAKEEKKSLQELPKEDMEDKKTIDEATEEKERPQEFSKDDTVDKRTVEEAKDEKESPQESSHLPKEKPLSKKRGRPARVSTTTTVSSVAEPEVASTTEVVPEDTSTQRRYPRRSMGNTAATTTTSPQPDTSTRSKRSRSK